MLEIIKFDSFKKGKNLLVLGAVHGNEICGYKAISKIVNKIKNGKITVKSGSITFIPICNPEANIQNKRFIDINLNRVFKKITKPAKYEEIISQKIIKYIDKCDYLLDIHSIPTDGPSFAFLDKDNTEVKEFVEMQNFKHIIKGWNELYDGEDNSTCGYGFRKGKICVTIECGNHNDPNGINLAETAIQNSLAYLKIADCQSNINESQSKYIEMEKVIYKSKNGNLSKCWNHLDKVKKGEIIAKYDDGEEIKADRDYLMIMPHNDDNVKIGNEWFYLGKFL